MLTDTAPLLKRQNGVKEPGELAQLYSLVLL